MFTRKLFKIGDKVKWLALELVIVFIGVYMAFFLQSYSEDQKLSVEKEKVLVSLKLELEEFRTSFPRFANFQREKIKEWDSLFAIQEIADYYNWRYYEPQYNVRVIEYALNKEGTEIIDFETYEELSNIYARIGQLEFAERKMTEFGDTYYFIPQSIPENAIERKVREADNRFMFYKFLQASRSRARSLEDISDQAANILTRINDELGEELVRKTDLSLLKQYIESDAEPDFVIEIFNQYFPQYSNEEITKAIEAVNPQQE